METKEFYETKYSFDEIEVDPRFRICEKEMKLAFGVQIAFTLISVFVAYSLGSGDPKNYTYIMGLPAFWFASIVILFIFLGIIIFITKKVFKDMDLTDEVA